MLLRLLLQLRLLLLLCLLLLLLRLLLLRFLLLPLKLASRAMDFRPLQRPVVILI